VSLIRRRLSSLLLLPVRSHSDLSVTADSQYQYCSTKSPHCLSPYLEIVFSDWASMLAQGIHYCLLYQMVYKCIKPYTNYPTFTYLRFLNYFYPMLQTITTLNAIIHEEAYCLRLRLRRTKGEGKVLFLSDTYKGWTIEGNQPGRYTEKSHRSGRHATKKNIISANCDIRFISDGYG